MYCPRCATQNVQDAKFCRSCGANLSLVPQALSGRFPSDRASRVEEAIRWRRQPNLARGITRVSLGIALLLVIAGIFFTKGAIGAEIWLFIPAFALIGKGVADVVNALSIDRNARQAAMPPPVQSTGELPQAERYNSLEPASITEGTTRHLEDAPLQSRTQVEKESDRA